MNTIKKTIIAGDFNMIENDFSDRLGINPEKKHIQLAQKL